MWQAFLTYNQDFTTFGRQHWVALLVLGVLAVMLTWVGLRLSAPEAQWKLARGMALFISLTVVSSTFLRWFLGDFDRTTDLPVDICNILALFLPILMWNPNYRIYEIIVFWVLLGTLMALFTPHLINGFPNFTYFKYWIVHGGLVVFMIYVSVVQGWSPGRPSVLWSFLYLQGYIITALIANLLLGANYVYLLNKPPTASPLDWLGPWPWYLLVADALALVAFYLLYQIFRLLRAIPANL